MLFNLLNQQTRKYKFRVRLVDWASAKGLSNQPERQVANSARQKADLVDGTQVLTALNARPRSLHFIVTMENH